MGRLFEWGERLKASPFLTPGTLDNAVWWIVLTGFKEANPAFRLRLFKRSGDPSPKEGESELQGHLVTDREDAKEEEVQQAVVDEDDCWMPGDVPNSTFAALDAEVVTAKPQKDTCGR